MNIRAVIFDVYGTLLEVGPPPPNAEDHWQALCRNMLHTSAPVSRLNFFAASSKVIARHHKAARERGIPWPEVHWPTVVAEVLPELAQLPRHDQEEFFFRQIQTGHTTRLTEETATTLRTLLEGPALLGIASNAQAYTLRELGEALAQHGLGMALFEPDLCFWSFQHGFSKPDPHVFRILSARLAERGILPHETLMVGDRLDNDIAPALAHGWQTRQFSPSCVQPSSGLGGCIPR